jgi:hypothetical protein
MKRSRRKTLFLCLELWEWLRDNPKKNKYDWPGWKKYKNVKAACFACEYRDYHKKAYCSSTCIIPWESNGCCSEGGSYLKWLCTYNNKQRSKYASQVVELIKQAIDELPKP